MELGAASFSWSAKTIEPSRARSRLPSSARTSSPKVSTTAASPGVPGATTSRAMRSASISTAPRSTSSRDTSLLPAPMPPVRPTDSMTVPPPLTAPPVRGLGADLVGRRDAGRLREHVAAGRGARGGVVLVLQALDEGGQLVVALLDLPVDLGLGALGVGAQRVGDAGQDQTGGGGDGLQD